MQNIYFKYSVFIYQLFDGVFINNKISDSLICEDESIEF